LLEETESVVETEEDTHDVVVGDLGAAVTSPFVEDSCHGVEDIEDEFECWDVAAWDAGVGYDGVDAEEEDGAELGEGGGVEVRERLVEEETDGDGTDELVLVVTGHLASGIYQ
jgi:hypothetical protein